MAPSRIHTPPAETAALPSVKHSKSSADGQEFGLEPADDDMYGKYHPADPDTLNLESNFGPMEPGLVGFLQPTSPDTALEIMHERFDRDGYLLVR